MVTEVKEEEGRRGEFPLPAAYLLRLRSRYRRYSAAGRGKGGQHAAVAVVVT